MPAELSTILDSDVATFRDIDPKFACSTGSNEIIKQGRVIPPRIEPERETPEAQAPSITVAVSAAGVVRKAMRFRSSAHAQLWNEVGSISHPDYPFLDPLYSPGSLMPAADFSPWVAARIAIGDWDSILELLHFIGIDDQVTALRRTFQSHDFGRFIEADARLLSELQAIAILSYRIPSTGHEDSRVSLLAELYEHALASYGFTISEAGIPHLLDAGNRVIRRRNREFKDLRPPEPLLTRDTIASPELRDMCPVGEALRRWPVTFRACISYSLDRGSPVPGTIRPQLQGHYGLRQFGLSDRQNSRYFADCGLFEPPSDLSPLASRLSKAELLQIAASHNIDVTKSWKKERITELLLNNEAARCALAAKAPEHLVQLRCDVAPAFDAWRVRVAGLRNEALCLACS